MLGRWKHHGCVQLNNTNRMACNMTFSVTLTRDQIFQLTFSGQLIDASRRLTRQTRWRSNQRHTSFESKVFIQKPFSQKRQPGSQTVDLRSNLRTLLRKAFERAIECTFPQAALHLYWFLTHAPICKKLLKLRTKVCESFTFGDLQWPQRWPDQKWHR